MFVHQKLEGKHFLRHNMQSHDGLLDEKTEEVHNLNHKLQSPDGLLDEISEEEWKMCSFHIGMGNSFKPIRTMDERK